MEALDSHNIPRSNFIGFAADGASNIMGENNSLTSRLKDRPGITVFRCICHSIHLAASEAAKQLPRKCEDLLRDIYSFFSHSAKRKHELKIFQNFCNVKPHKILHPCQTRWLSYHEVARILEQWQPLRLYFIEKETELRLLSIQNIIEKMRDPSVRMYLTFLNYILPKFKKINLKFQSNEPTIHLLQESITELLGSLLRSYCSAEYFININIADIDPTDDKIFLPTNQIYLGPEMHQLFQDQSTLKHPTLITDVKSRCRDFLITMVVQIKKRFPMDSDLWKMASFLSPQKIMDKRTRDKMNTLVDLTKAVPRLFSGNINELDDEWRKLDFVNFPEEWKRLSAEDFSIKIMDFEDHTGHKKYYNFALFALQVLALPTSNADAERLFSVVGNVKTKIRNSLQIPSLTALIKVSEAVKADGGCIKFNPNNALLSVCR
ncbi:uncharacterized protein LOC143026929 isoform X1 [Oratosquilla oratoria]|uniref:uncharacterized protein LOC143026929 isoform X1 n=1 Tax=Oratosquilla oratoria TaxID=337810 RepID=UPI003F765FC0